MSSNEPDVFVAIMKLFYSVAIYLAGASLGVYVGTKVLRVLGVTP